MPDFHHHLSAADFLERRKALRINQTQLANLLDVSLVTVARWEQAKRAIPGHVCLLMHILSSGTIRAHTDFATLTVPQFLIKLDFQGTPHDPGRLDRPPKLRAGYFGRKKFRKEMQEYKERLAAKNESGAPKEEGKESKGEEK